MITVNTVQYSPVGASLARGAMRSYDASNRWNDADRFIGSGLQSIIGSGDVTAHEKAIASLGWSMGNHTGMAYQNSAQARRAAAQAIASACPGSIGHVLAQVGIDAYGPANRWNDADAITGDALLAITENPESSAAQKQLAHSAWDQTNVGGIRYENSARTRYQALQQIAQEEP
ncbi:MAG: hypothetical protein HY319_14570 [Armatimonadetes bacterium]|nr:hypothetical protein [Armatimonadota bacterium]